MSSGLISSVGFSSSGLDNDAFFKASGINGGIAKIYTFIISFDGTGSDLVNCGVKIDQQDIQKNVIFSDLRSFNCSGETFSTIKNVLVGARATGANCWTQGNNACVVTAFAADEAGNISTEISLNEYTNNEALHDSEDFRHKFNRFEFGVDWEPPIVR